MELSTCRKVESSTKKINMIDLVVNATSLAAATPTHRSLLKKKGWKQQKDGEEEEVGDEAGEAGGRWMAEEEAKDGGGGDDGGRWFLGGREDEIELRIVSSKGQTAVTCLEVVAT